MKRPYSQFAVSYEPRLYNVKDFINESPTDAVFSTHVDVEKALEAAKPYMTELQGFSSSYSDAFGSDYGLYDVLVSFASSLGYMVTNLLPEKWTFARKANGAIRLGEGKIWVRGFLTKLEKSNVLAHEIAHIYADFLRLSGYKTNELEQIVEATSCAILSTFGLDYLTHAQNYIYSCAYLGSLGEDVKNFFAGELDREVAVVYYQFHNDLMEFLATT